MKPKSNAEAFSIVVSYLLFKKIRPLYYNWLSRYLPTKSFDKLLNLFFSSSLESDVNSIEGTAGNFIFKNDEKQTYIDIIKEHYGEYVKNIISHADLILDHVFDLLGSGPTNLGPEIDWHRDFKSGFRWDLKPYDRIKRIRLENSADIKIPWELSRFQHFNTLGQAYWISGKEKYAREFVSQLLHWIKHNPPRKGVNWCCSMEVAIRLVNWISAYFFFRDSPLFEKEVKVLFFKYILIQQIFIYHNLEFGYRAKENGIGSLINGNHYLAGLMGLIIPSILFPGLSSKVVLKKAMILLTYELSTQIKGDGVHFELSIGYHRLITEMLVLVAIIKSRNSQNLSQPMSDKIQDMIEFIFYYTRPDGLAPQVRDSDDGRLISFDRNSISDHRYLLNIGAVLFNRKDFKGAAPFFSHEALWWLGPDGFNKFVRISALTLKHTSKAFPESGFYFMRKNGDYLLGLCAEVGMNGYGGHGHNDALSFELFSKGRSILIDPGTFVYSANPKMRNLFRSTAYHNTVRIDRLEINRYKPSLLFEMGEEAYPKVEKWITKENFDILIASHKGYGRLNEKVIHRRIIFFNKIKWFWKISDFIVGDGCHLVQIFFHFAPGLVPEIDGKNCSVVVQGNNNFKLLLEMKNHKGWHIELEKGWVSPSYGRKNEAWIVNFNKYGQLPTKTNFIIRHNDADI